MPNEAKARLLVCRMIFKFVMRGAEKEDAVAA
jgi:hypothetical protein